MKTEKYLIQYQETPCGIWNTKAFADQLSDAESILEESLKDSTLNMKTSMACCTTQKLLDHFMIVPKI